jgi:hypothetical protein
MKSFVITLFLSLFTTWAVAQDRSFTQIIYDNEINLSNKSLTSWIRIFNSASKLQELGYNVSEKERFTVLKALKTKKKKSKNRYSRTMR